jgi:hypothetical protein
VGFDSFGGMQFVLRQFATEHKWDRFHFRNNLAMALAVEVVQFPEHFKWLGDGTAAVLLDQVPAPYGSWGDAVRQGGA